MPKSINEDISFELQVEEKRHKAKRLKRIHFIADKVEEARANNKSAYGIITKHVKEGKELYSTITDSTMKNEIRRRKIRREREATNNSIDDAVSPEDYSNDTTHTSTNSIMNSGWFGSDCEMITDPKKDKQYKHVPTYCKRKNKGGRPKGTTKENKIQLKKAKIAAMNLIVETYDKELKERRKVRGKNARLKCGRLEVIIANTKREFNLPKDVKIKTSAIRTRLAEGRKLKVVSQGCEPPIYEFEPLLVEWLSLAYNSRMCLSVGNALCLANSLISGTVYERKMIDFKQHHKMSYDPNCVLEETWFQGFMKRNEDKLTCMRGHSFSLDRDSWSTYQNMNAMYDMIEACLIDCGIAEKIDPIWVDKEGKEVVSEEDAYGCKCTIRIIHPDYMLCVDEVGSNIDMTGDGHAGGELYISVAKKGPPQIKISTKNKHWTTLGLTAMNGEPVMCVLIFASKKKDAYRELGVDCTVDLDGEIEDFETVHDYIIHNSGAGKAFQHAPTCTFRGKSWYI